MRTSPPSALIWNRSPFEPGTRSISPKEQKITPGRRAMACARSSISSGVTQTGQPGPCTSSTSAGSSSSRPYLTMECVWPPQTSMSVHGRVTVRRISPTSVAASRPSRYSSRYFMGFFRRLARSEFGELAHFAEDLVSARSLFFIHAADGEADVHHHVIAEGGFRQIFEAGFAENAAEVHLGHLEALRVMQADDLPRYGQAHLHIMLAGIASARWRWESGGHLDRIKTHKNAQKRLTFIRISTSI